MKYDMEWVKIKIIQRLDKKYDDACWSNLVMWMIGGQTFKETFEAEGNWREQSCTNINGDYAYCGKCVRTGRLKE